MRAVVVTIVLGLGTLIGGLSPAVVPAAKVWRVGVLAGSDSIAVPPVAYALASRLGALGYTEGKDLVLESRFAHDNDELPRLAGELAAAAPDLVVAEGAPAVAAAMAATRSQPIVGLWMAGFQPPRPAAGPGLTGVALQQPNRQRLEVLQTLVPGLARVAVIRNLPEPEGWADLEQAARALGLELHPVTARPSDDGDAVLKQVRAAGASALLVPDASTRAVVMRLQATAGGVPVLFPQAYWVRPPLNGLISLGVDNALVHERIAVLVNEVLKGARAGDLPVDVVSRLELVINRRRANDLRLTIPPALLQRADRVIE